MGFVATWTITHQNIRELQFAHAPFVTVNNLGVGGLIGFAFGWYDVQRQRTRMAAEAEYERLEQFVGIVSHDLRNPLNLVQGRLELAAEETDSDLLTAAQDALDRSFALVEDL